MGETSFPVFSAGHASGSRVEYAPARGGMVTSLVLGGKEIFYFDRATFDDSGSSVRGGIPVLFPNAGELENGAYPNLHRHGFAREGRWSREETENGFREIFLSNDGTRAAFPFDFKLTFEGELLSFSSARFSLRAENVGNVPLPVAMGLHPYFRVPSPAKKDIKFPFPGGEEIERRKEEWISGGTVSIANPGRFEVLMPEGTRLILTPSAECRRIWIWSEEGKDFVCVEPVMRDPGGIISDPRMVLPGEGISLDLEIGIA